MTGWVADTSVAVPALLAGHTAHASVIAALRDRTVSLAAHSALESYSVLTRLPGDARLAPADAVHLLDVRFGRPVVLPDRRAADLVAELADLGIAGGAVYDALIAATAATADATLLTRDIRAAATYQRVDAAYELVS